MAKKPEPDPVREMLREVGFTDEQIYATLGDLTPAQGRREGDRLYREYDAVVHFAEARQAVMKCDLKAIDHRQPPNDRPDALAMCSSLGEVGIEVADIRPEMSEEELEKFRRTGKDPMPADAAAALIQRWIEIKDKKRQEPEWARADNSILLLRTFKTFGRFVTI